MRYGNLVGAIFFALIFTCKSPVIPLAVLELKRISRDYNIPVLGISSFNRDNYTAPVNLASFKESGAIEYTSDVLIGLQYSGMDFTDDDSDSKSRTRRIRELIEKMERLGATGDKQPIRYN